MGERRMEVLVGEGSVREIFAIEARRLYGCADLILETREHYVSIL